MSLIGMVRCGGYTGFNFNGRGANVKNKPALEKTIVKNILAYLRGAGWWAKKFHGSPFQDAGIPDILAIKVFPSGPQILALEVKRPGGAPATPIQLKTLADLEAAGAIASVVHSVEEVELLLKIKMRIGLNSILSLVKQAERHSESAMASAVIRT